MKGLRSGAVPPPFSLTLVVETGSGTEGGGRPPGFQDFLGWRLEKCLLPHPLALALNHMCCQRSSSYCTVPNEVPQLTL